MTIGRLKAFRVKIYFEYITEINVHFILYKPPFSYFFFNKGNTIYTKLQAGCEVWEFNLELKHIRVRGTLRNPLSKLFPNL